MGDMIHAKARMREEFSEKVVRAETRRRGGVALAAQRPSQSLAATGSIPAGAGVPSSFSSASPRLRANKILLNLFAPSRSFGFAQDRRRVNQILPGPPHV
ncbi:hypothetical protein SPHINGOT1_260191 [Sphingomonas sp. T1]|nr:hypothetical protein SPHINGOT1_260191 [Sphingomonas sp. T1]